MKQTLLTLLLILSFTYGFGQIGFYKLYGEEGYDYGNSIVQLEDSSYVIAGSSGSFDVGHSQAFLLRVDSVGNYIWSFDYGGLESESAEKVLYKENVGFFICGYTNSMGNGAFDFYLSKIDPSGGQLWERTYGTSDWERAIDMAFTQDTGLVIVGEARGDSTQNSDIRVIRVDSNGDTLWTQSFGGFGDDVPTSIESYQDSLFIISSNRYIQDSLTTKAYLMLMHEDGTMLWEDTLGSGIGYYALNDFFVVNDTLYGIGSHKTNDTIASDIYYYRMRINGSTSMSLIHDFGIHSADDYYGDLITNYGDNTFRYGAYRVEAFWSSPGGPDLHIGKHVHTMGWIAGVGIIDGINPDIGNQAIPTSDGGAAMVGYTSSGGTNGTTGATIFLLKIGPNELYPSIEGVTYVFNLVSFEELSGEEKFMLYPNPTSDAFHIKAPGNGFYKYTLVNMTGRELMSGTFTNEKQVNISGVDTGMYVVRIENEQGAVSAYRVIVK